MRNLTLSATFAFFAIFGVMFIVINQVRAADGWPAQGFGSFSLKLPDDMTQTPGIGDSNAGTIEGRGLNFSYDFGPYADPLTQLDKVSGLRTVATRIDGLMAHEVSYTQLHAKPALRHCVGVHVPQVRQSSMGDIRFTLVACSADRKNLTLAKKIMATIKFLPLDAHAS